MVLLKVVRPIKMTGEMLQPGNMFMAEHEQGLIDRKYARRLTREEKKAILEEYSLYAERLFNKKQTNTQFNEQQKGTFSSLIKKQEVLPMFKEPGERKDLHYKSMIGTESVQIPRMAPAGSIYKKSTDPGSVSVQFGNLPGYIIQQFQAANGQGGTRLQETLEHFSKMTNIFTADSIAKLKGFAYKAEQASYRPDETNIVCQKACDYISSLKLYEAPDNEFNQPVKVPLKDILAGRK